MVENGKTMQLEYVDLSAFIYYTETGTSAILGPLVAGIIFGSCYSLLLQASAYSGGTDFISAIIHKRNPNKSVLGISFILNVIVAVSTNVHVSSIPISLVS